MNSIEMLSMKKIYLKDSGSSIMALMISIDSAEEVSCP